LEFFEEHPGVNVEGFRDRLLYYVGKKLPPKKVRDFMTDGFNVLSLFRGSNSSAPQPARAD
jgi:hypothetical protein